MANKKQFLIGVGLTVASVFGAPLLAGATSAAWIVRGVSALRAISMSMGLGLIGKSLQGARREAVDRRVQGAKMNPRSTQANVPVVYGKARIGMATVDVRVIVSDGAVTPGSDPTAIFSGADNNDVLCKVGAFCVGSENGLGIQAINNVRMYDDGVNAITTPAAFSLDASTTGVTAKYRPGGTGDGFLKYTLEAGTDAQVVRTQLDTQLGWTQGSTAVAGRGIAYGAFYCNYDEEVWDQGFPTITADVTGNRVYDPRTPAGGPNSDGYINWSATGASSDNPALCILDYLTSKRYGGAVPYAARDGGGGLDFIDETSFQQAANYCDELVSIPGMLTEKRFVLNGVVPTNRMVGANVLEMLAACRGEIVWQNGKYRLIIREVAASESFELTEDNIIGELKWTRMGTTVPNQMEATFPNNSSGEYDTDSVAWPPASSTTYITEDNGVENRAELALQYVTGKYQAQRIIMTMLKEARQDVSVSLTATQAAYTLEVGDVVDVTHEGPGWVQKSFRVREMILMPEGTVGLSLQSYDAAAYTLATLEEEEVEVATELPNPNRPYTTVSVYDDRFVSSGEVSATTGTQAWRRRLRLQIGAACRSLRVQYSLSRPTVGGGSTAIARDYNVDVTPNELLTVFLSDGAASDQQFWAQDDTGTTIYDSAFAVTITPNDEALAGGLFVGDFGLATTSDTLDLEVEDDVGIRVDAEIATKITEYTGPRDNWVSFAAGVEYIAQQFTIPSGGKDIRSVAFRLRSVGSPVGSIQCFLYSNDAAPAPDTPDASVKIGTSVQANTITAATDGEDIEFFFEEHTLAAGLWWAVLASFPQVSNYIDVGVDASTPSYGLFSEGDEFFAWTSTNTKASAAFAVTETTLQTAPARKLTTQSGLKFSWLPTDGRMALSVQADAAGGAGVGTHGLTDHTDVTLTAPVAGDFLRYSGFEWVNAVISLSDLPAIELTTLTDVNTSTATNRNVLVADGVDWESRALVVADVSDLDTDFATASIVANVTIGSFQKSLLDLSEAAADRIVFFDLSSGVGLGEYAFLEVAGGLEIPVGAPTTIQVDAGAGLQLTGGEVATDLAGLGTTVGPMVSTNRFIINFGGVDQQIAPANIPATLLDTSGLPVGFTLAGDGLVNVGGAGTTVAVEYDAAANVISEGNDLTGATIVSTDRMLVYDVTAVSSRAGFINISQLPFTNNAGDVTGVSEIALGGITVTSQTGPVPAVGLDIDTLTDDGIDMVALDRFAIHSNTGGGSRKIAPANMRLDLMDNSVSLFTSGGFTLAGDGLVASGSTVAVEYDAAANVISEGNDLTGATIVGTDRMLVYDVDAASLRAGFINISQLPFAPPGNYTEDNVAETITGAWTFDSLITGTAGYAFSGVDATAYAAHRILGGTNNPGLFVRATEASKLVEIYASGTVGTNQVLSLGAGGASGVVDIVAAGATVNGTLDVTGTGSTPLALTRTTTSNVAISVTNNDDTLYFGMNSSELFAVNDTADLGSTPAFTVNPTSGNTEIAGTLDVTGVSTFSGLLNANANIRMTSAAPVIDMRENDQALDEGYWRFVADGGYFYLQTRTDVNGAGVDALKFVRTSGTTVDQLEVGSRLYVNSQDTVLFRATNLAATTALQWDHRIQASGNYELRSVNAGATVVTALSVAHATGDATFVGDVRADSLHIGGSAYGAFGNRFTGDFTSNGVSTAAAHLSIGGTVIGAVGDTSWLTVFGSGAGTGGGVTTQSGTEDVIGAVSTLRLGAPTITNNLWDVTLGEVISTTSNGTVNTTLAHGWTGSTQKVYITGHSDANYNGWWTITVVDTDTFTLNGWTGTASGTGGNVYEAGRITRAATLYINDEPTAGKDTGIDEAWGIYTTQSARLGSVTSAGIVPVTDATYALGSATNRWNTIYGTALDITGQFLAGDGSLTDPAYGFTDHAGSGMYYLDATATSLNFALDDGLELSLETNRWAFGGQWTDNTATSLDTLQLRNTSGLMGILGRTAANNDFAITHASSDAAWLSRIVFNGTTPYVHIEGSGGANWLKIEPAAVSGTDDGILVGDVSMKLQSDIGRFSDGGLRVQATGTNQDANFMLMPSGTNITSRIRLYNASDPANTEAINIQVSGAVFTLQTAEWGTPTTDITSMDFQINGTNHLQLGANAGGVSWVYVPGVLRVGNELRLADGNVADPSMAFTSQENTGWYYSSSQINWTVNGVRQMYLGAGGLSLIDPTETNFRMYETDAATDEGNFRIVGSGGDLYFQSFNDAGAGFDTAMRFQNSAGVISGIILGTPLKAEYGTAAAPPYSFSSEPTTGMFGSAGLVRFAVSGAESLRISSSLIQGFFVYRNVDGVAGGPAYSFTNDATTGMWLNGAGNLRFSTAGVERLTISSTGITAAVGITATSGIDITGASQVLNHNTTDDRTKIRVWNSALYGLGMGNSYTFGGLSSYAMTFQMNTTAGRGWWWGTDVDGNDDGSMSLTNTGLLTVASGMRIGYGSPDTTAPTANLLDISGSLSISGGQAYSQEGTEVTRGTAGAVTLDWDAYNQVALRNDGNIDTINIDDGSMQDGGHYCLIVRMATSGQAAITFTPVGVLQWQDDAVPTLPLTVGDRTVITFIRTGGITLGYYGDAPT